MTPCRCGEELGGRYEHEGLELCWSCWTQATGLGPLPPYKAPDPRWVAFRKRLLNALWALDETRFVYLDEDTVLGECPICGTGTARIFFRGRAPRADLSCSLGCAELDIAQALAGGRVER